MAQQKKCSGSVIINNYFLLNPACNYNVTMLIDTQPINTPVAINSGMTTAQISNLFNSNRTGNTTGTISTQQIGNDLQITISDIILSPSSSGAIDTSIININGGGCPDITSSFGSLTCILETITTGGGGGGAYIPPAIVCFRRQYDIQRNLIPCPPERIHYGYIYILISSDSEKCCYKKKVN